AGVRALNPRPDLVALLERHRPADHLPLTAWLRRFQGRERDVRDESASVCLGGAGRQCVWMFGRRPGAPCSDTANTSVPWKESLQDTTGLYSKSGRLSSRLRKKGMTTALLFSTRCARGPLSQWKDAPEPSPPPD